MQCLVSFNLIWVANGLWSCLYTNGIHSNCSSAEIRFCISFGAVSSPYPHRPTPYSQISRSENAEVLNQCPNHFSHSFPTRFDNHSKYKKDGQVHSTQGKSLGNKAMLKSSRSICCPRKRSNTAKHKPVLRSGREGSKTFQILVCCHSPDENVTWGEQSTQLPAWAMSDTTTAIYERLPPLSVIPNHWTHILCLHNSSKHSFQSENCFPARLTRPSMHFTLSNYDCNAVRPLKLKVGNSWSHTQNCFLIQCITWQCAQHWKHHITKLWQSQPQMIIKTIIEVE